MDNLDFADAHEDGRKRFKVDGIFNGVTGDSELGVSGVEVDAVDVELQHFVQWCLSGPCPFVLSPKVQMSRSGSCAGYGMIALADIDQGEEIFGVPQQRTLTWENVARLAELRPEMEELARKSRWAPTMLAVLLEDLLQEGQSSWYPYLRLFLHHSQLDLPLSWDKDDQGILLQGTEISKRIAKDRLQMEKDFRQLIFPMLQRLAAVPSSAFDELLQRAVKVASFVMAYSFTRPMIEEDMISVASKENMESDEEEKEEEELRRAVAEIPLMVPVADVLNASISKNNAKLHWGLSPQHPLTMIAIKPIKAGEEVFNTYGEISNEEMLYLYGYAEDDLSNPFEEVFLPCSLLHQVLTSMVEQKELHGVSTAHQLERRWRYLQKKIREHVVQFRTMRTDSLQHILIQFLRFDVLAIRTALQLWFFGALQNLFSAGLVGEDVPVVLGRQEILTGDELEKILSVLAMNEDMFSDMSSQNNEDEEEVEEEDGDGMDLSIENLTSLDPVTKSVMSRVVQAKVASYPRSLEEEEALVQQCQQALVEKRNFQEQKQILRELWCACVRKVQLNLLSLYLQAVT